MIWIYLKYLIIKKFLYWNKYLIKKNISNFFIMNKSNNSE